MARRALRISEEPRAALIAAELLREHVPGYRATQNRVNRSARQTELRFAQKPPRFRTGGPVRWQAIVSLEQRLNELNIELPISAAAGGAYAPVVVHGDTIYVSGQLPRDGDKVHVVGQVGRDVTPEEARRGARLALIRGLAAIKAHLGSLDNVTQILKLTVFVHSAADFSGQTAVADGASELIMELFGPERGLHTRTSVGVAQLPRNASIEVELIAALAR